MPVRKRTAVWDGCLRAVHGLLSGRRGRRGRSAALLALATLLFASPLSADFLTSRRLSDPQFRVRQAKIGVDLSFNAYVVWTAGQDMFVDIIKSSLEQQLTLSDTKFESGDPDVATNSIGTTYIIFTQTQDDPVVPGRDVFLVDNYGATFPETPVNVSQSQADDYAPKICLDPTSGQPHLVWAQGLGKTTRVVYRKPGGPAVPVATGDYPAIAVTPAGIVQLVYVRNNDLYALNNRGGAFGPEATVTRTPFDGELFPSVAVSDSGNVFVAYERRNALYYHQSTDGGVRFGPPRLIDSGTTPELRVTGDLLSIVYEKKGDIYYILGKVGSALVSPVLVTAGPDGHGTPQVETNPSLAVDVNGSLHISYLSDGGVFYTNNIGQLTAEFTVDRREGEVPLEVHFKDLSSGAVQDWRWDFGDGSPESIERNPVHTYHEPGKYSVALKIFGIGSEATLEKKNFIFVQTPNNRLWISDQLCLPGQHDIWYPVTAMHKDPLQGFEIAGVFDPNVLTLKTITYAGTAIEILNPEFFGPSISNDPSNPYFYAGVIFDFKAPWDNQTLPPGTQRIMYLVFDCSDLAPQGGVTVIEPKNGVGPREEPPAATPGDGQPPPPPAEGSLHNVFVIQGIGALPVLKPSITTIVDGFPPPVFFLRGDVDQNHAVELTDAVAILGYLFLGKEEPRCMDSADFDDSGNVDIADAIGLLSFLFLGGVPPAVPFPNQGLDPTEDGLKVCAH